MNVQISQNDDISNVIILIKQKYETLDEQKKEAKKALMEKGYDVNTIDEWIGYLD